MLKLIHDSRQKPAPRTDARRVRALASALWEAEITQARMLSSWADTTRSQTARARVLVLASLHRLHASRLLARMAALGRAPIPVPHDPPALFSLSDCASMPRAMAERCENLKEAAAPCADLSTGWVADLNRTENFDSYRELAMLAEAE